MKNKFWGIKMSTLFFSILFFLLFQTTYSAENSSDLNNIIDPRIQNLINLLNDAEQKNEFKVGVKKFVLSFSDTGEQLFPKIMYRQLKDLPNKFLRKLTRLIHCLFSSGRENQWMQIRDALIVRSYFLNINGFSIHNLTLDHILVGQSVHNFISEIILDSQVGASHIGIALAEFLNDRFPEDIILFAVLKLKPAYIYAYLGIFKTNIDSNFDFPLLTSCISFAVQFYKEHLGVEDEIILRKLAIYSRTIKTLYMDFVFSPIMSLRYGSETFIKLKKSVLAVGKEYSFRLIICFPLEYQIAYFMMLANSDISISPSEKAQKFLNDLKFLIYDPRYWVISLDHTQLLPLIVYIQTEYLPHFPMGTLVRVSLENIIWILRKENESFLLSVLDRSG